MWQQGNLLWRKSECPPVKCSVEPARLQRQCCVAGCSVPPPTGLSKSVRYGIVLNSDQIPNEV